ncbi:MAG: hypothetical protein BWX68_02776 [Verrucomicrobia bacterium ADurb.Bin063]|nr:MAG: hypothetical protein BWX68_02776 [Verrucomicrobia bacterium ADurb.Bin063]
MGDIPGAAHGKGDDQNQQRVEGKLCESQLIETQGAFVPFNEERGRHNEDHEAGNEIIQDDRGARHQREPVQQAVDGRPAHTGKPVGFQQGIHDPDHQRHGQEIGHEIPRRGVNHGRQAEHQRGENRLPFFKKAAGNQINTADGGQECQRVHKSQAVDAVPDGTGQHRAGDMQQRRMHRVAHIRLDAGEGRQPRARAAVARVRKHGLVVVPRHNHVRFFIGAHGMVVRGEPPDIGAQMETQQQEQPAPGCGKKRARPGRQCFEKMHNFHHERKKRDRLRNSL